MKKYFLYFIIANSLYSCKVLNKKDNVYKTPYSTTEIGSIGLSKSTFFKDEFITHSIPLLEEKIRVNVTFTSLKSKHFSLFGKKSKINQTTKTPSQDTDSIESNPQIVKISLLDISGFLKEIQSPYNENVLSYLENIEKAKLVSSILLYVSHEDLIKLKTADSFYLVNNQTSKYSLVLFKEGKKTDFVNLNPNKIIGYDLSTFCWAENKKGDWYLAEILDDSQSCKGKTYNKVKKKDTNRLFKI